MSPSGKKKPNGKTPRKKVARKVAKKVAKKKAPAKTASAASKKTKAARKKTRKAKKKNPRKSPRGARQKKPGRRRGARQSAGLGSVLWPLAKALAAFVLVASVAATIYGFILDARIKDRFVGQPWAQPARVFARPVDLYVGLSLSGDELQKLLTDTGYRQVRQPSRAGEYARTGNQLRVVTRGLDTAGIPSVALDVFFAGNTLIELADGAGEPVPLATLEPPMIGSIIARGGEDRMVVGASGVPELLKQALIAVEDRRFATHHGLDFRGIVRAAFTNIKAGALRQGGSTLTQQLIKSHFLSNERTWRRKFNEALMAISLDARMTKDDILLAYINEIYLGQDGGRAIHGFDLASRFYFSRRLNELELHQIATLTGMVKGPSQFNPRRHPEAALARRNVVISLLQQQQVISAEAAADAAAAPLGITTDRTGNFGGYPTVMAMVKRQLLSDYESDDLTSSGLSVFTTLDVIAQQRVEQTVQAAVASLEQGDSGAQQLQTAAAVLAPDTGELIALVGGREAGFDGFNRALDMRRPVGSLIKPFVFLTALESGRYDLDSRVSNEELDLELDNGRRWQPRNFTEEYGGEVPVFKVLTQSINTPTVRVGMDVGVGNVVETLKRLGLEHEVDLFPSLLLGAVELTPLEMTQLYLGLAGRGFVTPPRVVSAVKNAAGQELSRYPLEVTQAASATSTYQIVHTLALAARQGTGRRLNSLLPGVNVAGKTGSTNDLRDSWYAGISQTAVAVVWVGRDDNAPINLTGAQGALPIWASLMRALDAGSLRQFPPDSLAQAPFDFASGEPVAYCDSAVLIPLRPEADRAFLYDCR